MPPARSLRVGAPPWVREVWLHTVDLDPQATLALLPADLQDVLLDDVAQSYVDRPGTAVTDLVVGDRTWRLGSQGEPVYLTREQALSWLTGRRCAQPVGLPPLPPWL